MTSESRDQFGAHIGGALYGRSSAALGGAFDDDELLSQLQKGSVRQRYKWGGIVAHNKFCAGGGVLDESSCDTGLLQNTDALLS